MTVQVSDRHMVRAVFRRHGRSVQDFSVTLHTLDGGPDDWLVRYETHGGRPHRHYRWDGDAQHHRLHSWPREHAAILSRAMEDLKVNWQEYAARHEAWKTG